MDREEKISKVNHVFSPSAPIEDKDLFFGRLNQFERLAEAIYERGQHALIYGDRGVGKTSLSNIAAKIYMDVIVSKVTCNRTEDFKSIWQKALDKISFSRMQQGIGFTAKTVNKSVQLDLFLPPDEDIDSRHIESVLRKLNNKLLFIFDEFDSIADDDVKTRMSDTIKMLSDSMSNVTVLIVGIAESVNTLIGNHPSIERCLMQIFTPKMSTEELGEIIDGGLSKIDMKINYPQRKKIVKFSSGYPSYTHLLCKHAAINAIRADRDMITDIDFMYAAKKAIENAGQSLTSSFQLATISNKQETLFLDVLYAIAMAEVDEYDCSSKTDIMDSLFNITQKEFSKQRINYYITELCNKDRGEILVRIGEKHNVRIKFKNPMMKAFVQIKYHSEAPKTV